MLKTTPAGGLAALAEVRHEKQDGKRIQVDGDEKEPAQPAQPVEKSCKS